MDKIQTALDVQGAGVEGFTVNVLRARRQPRLLPKEVSKEPALHAEINHGRWIVKCPFCSGAEMAEPGDPRFYCLSCYNEQAGGKWLKVIFPSTSHVKKIEAELLKRPKKANINWLPTETLKQLQDENNRQGVE